MKPIRAFIGHSFTDDDAEVSNTFLKYFDRLSVIHPNFSWSHAEPAEPKILADKLMQLIADKNLFIGICTKKERVVVPHVLKKSLIPSGYLKAREEDFAWKTSDWIIQEIGLAKGRNLVLILLIEEGLRPPGGLQGDIEYISFHRSAPERAFGKILEMISALSPKIVIAGEAEHESGSLGREPAAAQEAPQGDDWETPKPEWTRRDFEFALFRLVGTDNTLGAKKVSDAYLATEAGGQSTNRISWEAYGESVRIMFAKGGQLTKLKELSELHPENSDVLTYLARAYEDYHQESQAAVVFELAAEHATSLPQKLARLRAAALAHQAAGNSNEALRVIGQMKILAAESSKGEVEVLKTEQKFSEVSKEDEVLLGTMERLLEIDPSDNDTRFSLAYKYSELGNEKLALLHYMRIPNSDRSSTTWNNLGVAYDELDLPAKAVGSYRKSEEMGDTLAMSNLAKKLIRAGFLSEAQKICNLALGKEEYHKNVPKSAGRLKEVPEEEERKETELLEKAKLVTKFYQDFGRAVGKPTHGALALQWQGPQCILTVSFDGSSFKATGSYVRQSLGLIARAMLGTTRSDKEDSEFYKVEFLGKSRGRAIVGQVSRKREGEPPAVKSLLASEEEPKVLLVVSDDGREIRVLEQAKKSDPRFYGLKIHAG